MESLEMIYTIDEVSEYLKVPKSTMYMLTSKSRIPCFKVGKQLRFRKSSIDRWAQSQETFQTRRLKYDSRTVDRYR